MKVPHSALIDQCLRMIKITVTYILLLYRHLNKHLQALSRASLLLIALAVCLDNHCHRLATGSTRRRSHRWHRQSQFMPKLAPRCTLTAVHIVPLQYLEPIESNLSIALSTLRGRFGYSRDTR